MTASAKAGCLHALLDGRLFAAQAPDAPEAIGARFAKLGNAETHSRGMPATVFPA